MYQRKAKIGGDINISTSMMTNDKSQSHIDHLGITADWLQSVEQDHVVSSQVTLIHYVLIDQWLRMAV